MNYNKIITINDLNDQIKNIPERFCFIKCLKTSDKNNFINKYIDILNTDKTQLKYFDKGVIKISTWLKIMGEIELQNNYCVYRNSYYGESTGSKNITTQSETSCKSMLVEFGSDHISTVDLLIDNRQISKIYLFRRSNFVNVKQWFWDKII